IPTKIFLLYTVLPGLGIAFFASWVTSRRLGERFARTLDLLSARVQEKVGELTRERTQLSAILGALDEGVVAVDHEGKVLFLNDSAEKLFGVTSGIHGRPVLEVLRHNALHEVIQQTLGERKPVSQEISIHSPQERTLMVQSVPVSYGENETGVL